MKNIVLSAAAVFALSSFAVAGGDIAPVEEPVVEVPEVVVTDSGFYLGLAYGYMNVKSDETYNTHDAEGRPVTVNTTFLDDSFNEIMIQAGYKFNKYVAVEGRYWFGLEDTYDIDVEGTRLSSDISVDAWGLYVKPMYPVTDAFDIYALLGYGSADSSISVPVAYNTRVDAHTDSKDGFSWGLGVAYSFNDNVSVFIDYVNIYDDNDDYTTIHGDTIETDDTIDTWNFGVSYKF